MCVGGLFGGEVCVLGYSGEAGSVCKNRCVCVCECVIGGNECDDCNFGINNRDTLCRHMCFCVRAGMRLNACVCLCTRMCSCVSQYACGVAENSGVQVRMPFS